MKYFKIQPLRMVPRYRISQEVFAAVTGNKYPFEQVNEQGSLSQYAICPSCLNPIQIRGVMRQIKYRPHGRHTGENIKGLPDWDQVRYEYCPFAVKNNRKEPSDDYEDVVIDAKVVELYNLLKEQFDRVIYVVSEELDIRASKPFWKRILQQFLVNKIYCYPWLTEVNLPYIFAYFGMTHNRLYKQKVKNNSDLYNALSDYPGVLLEKMDKNYSLVTNKQGCFLNLFFRFTQHKQRARSGEDLVESMLFCVDDRGTGKTVFQKKIVFDELRFQRIVSSNKGTRQQWLLDIAAELMPELQYKNG